MNASIIGFVCLGTIIAKHIYIPKSAECNWVISSALNARMLSRYILWKARIEQWDDKDPENGGLVPRKGEWESEEKYIRGVFTTIHNGSGWRDGMNYMENIPDYFSHRMNKRWDPSPRRENIPPSSSSSSAPYLPPHVRVLLQLRDCTVPLEQCSQDWREWHSSTWNNTMSVMNHIFYAPSTTPRSSSTPSPRVIPLPSSNKILMNCMTCQIRDYYSVSHILMGIHGAGE